MPAVSKPLLGRQTESDAWRLKQGRFVRDLRRDAGLTQSELAALLGCGKPFVSQVETGKSHVPPDKLAMLAQIVGKSPEDLAKPMLRFQNPWIYSMMFGAEGDPELKRFLRNVPEHINQRRGPRW